MNKKILLIGGGGHCSSVLDSLLETKEYSEIGIIDKKEKLGHKILGVPIIGSDEDLPNFYQSGYKYAFITLGSIGDTSLRVKLFKNLEKIGFLIPNIIDKTAVVSKRTNIENGIFVGKKTIINAGTSVQKGSIINTGSIIEHDNEIGEFSHIAPGVVLCGDVVIGQNTHIGARAVIRQQVKVGSNTMVGTGSNVLTDIKSNVVAYGNPCKEVQIG